MSFIGSLLCILKADASAWRKGFDQAGKDTEKLKSKSNSLFKQLDSQFGDKSNLGRGLKIMFGGAAIGGIGLAINRFAQLGESLGKMSIDARTGAKNLTDVYDEIARGLPLIGGLVRGLEGLQEAWTGEIAAKQESARVSALRAEALKKEREEMERQKAAAEKAVLSIEERTRRTMRDARIAMKPEGQQEVRREAARVSDELMELARLKNEALRESGATLEAIEAASKFRNWDQADVLRKRRAEIEKSFQDAMEAAQFSSDVAIDNMAIDKLKAQWAEMKTAATEIWEASGKALRKNVTAPIEKVRTMIQLQNPRVQAEEVFGSRRVTDADVPQPFIEMEKTAKEQLKEQKATTNATQALLEPIKAFGKGFAIVTGW
jgi:hypothetical protein